MIGKIKCKECKCNIIVNIPERENNSGKKMLDMRGIKTRKYCSICGVKRKKTYITRRLHRKHNTQTEKIENKLLEHIVNLDCLQETTNGLVLESFKNNKQTYCSFAYRSKIKKIYDNVSLELCVPTDTIRRVMHNMRKNGRFK